MADLSSSEKADILKRARERLSYGLDRDDKNRQRQIDDTRFVYVPGEQWDKRTRSRREEWGDPCMEFPQLRQFVSQVVNDQRQNRPGIRVHPASGDASADVAEIQQGLIRGIEYESNAEAVYDCAYQHAVVGGRGYWRIVSEYEAANSFNQRLAFRRIPDPLSVVLDPDYRDPDGGDRTWGFVIETIQRAEFEATYPKADPLSYDEDFKHWQPDDKHVYVADYYERVAYKRKLVRLSTGETMWEDELPTPLPPGVAIVDVLEREDHRIDWYTIAGGEQILESHEWPGTIIPIVCTSGDEIIVAGERHYYGLTTHARGTQELFNYGMTAQAIHLGLTPRAPYVAAIGQIEGLESIWDSANEKNYSVLPYRPQSVDGTIVPPPQRQMGATPDAGWINWTQQMQLLMKSTIGMYENTLGMRGQETSGRAIIAREQQGDNATFHFQDNLSRAIALTGRILLELIPHYYDTERIVQIVMPDDKRKLVKINENGVLGAVQNDVRRGKFAVTVSAGPSYATKRQESADMLNQMVQAFPPLMQVAGDLVVKAQDIPDADLMAKRMRLAMPPNVQQAIQAEEESAGEGPVVPPEVKQQLVQQQQALQQMSQQMQGLMQQNQQLQAEAQSEEQKNMADAQAKQIELQMKQLDFQMKQIDAALSQQADAAKAQVELEKVALEREKLALERAKLGMPPGEGDPGYEQTMVAAQAEVERSQALIAAVNNAAAQFAEVAAALKAPKQTQLITDASGRPTSSITTPVLQ